MKHFALNHILDWEKLDPTRGYYFEVMRGTRRVQFTVNAQAHVEVYARGIDPETGEVDEGRILIAASDGQFSVDVKINRATAFEFDTAGEIYLRNLDRDHRVAKRDEASFTTLDPGHVVPTEMQIMQNMLMQTMGKMQRQLDQQRERGDKLQREMQEEKRRAEQSQSSAATGTQEVVEPGNSAEAPNPDAQATIDQEASQDASRGAKSNE